MPFEWVELDTVMFFLCM